MTEQEDYTRFMPADQRPREELRDQNSELKDEVRPQEQSSPSSSQSALKTESRPQEQSSPSSSPSALKAESRPKPYESILAAVARFFYDVFNPMLVPAYATLLIFEVSVLALTVPGAALVYSLTMLGATCVLPLLALFILRRVNLIRSISMAHAADRRIPYIVEIMALGAMTCLFVYKGAPAWLWTIYCGATVGVILNFIINFYFKVCNHATAIAAFLAALIVVQNYGNPLYPLGWWAIGTVIVCGIIGTASIWFGKHRLIDVMVGYATGFLPVILLSLIH